MADDKLIKKVREYITRNQTQIDLNAGGRDYDWTQYDAITAITRPLLEYVIETAATTLAGIKAKTVLYELLDWNREDLGRSLTRDILALA